MLPQGGGAAGSCIRRLACSLGGGGARIRACSPPPLLPGMLPYQIQQQRPSGTQGSPCYAYDSGLKRTAVCLPLVAGVTGFSVLDAVQEGGEAAAEGSVWAHLLPAAKRPPTLPALERLLLVPDAPDAGGSLDACQQQVRRLLQISCEAMQVCCLRYTVHACNLQ